MKLAVKGKRIVTAPGKEPEAGVMVVENGKIIAIGRDVESPSGAKLLDIGDHFLYPGFIDASSHLGINKEPFDYMVEIWDGCDTSSPFQPELRVTDGFNPFSSAITKARSVGITTAYAAAGHGMLMDGQGIVFKLVETEEAKDMFLPGTEQLHFCIGDYPLMGSQQAHRPPLTRMALMRMLRGELRRAQGILERKEAAPDEKTEILLRALKREIKVRIYVLAAQDIPLAVELGEEFGLDYILDGLYEAWKLPRFWKKHPQAVLLNGVLCGPMQNTLATKYEISMDNFSVLDQAGCEIVLTADGVTTTRLLPYIAGYAIGAGLPEEKALAAITTLPAKLLGLADRVGTLEVGKDADFTIYDGNALLSTSRCLATYINGEAVFMEIDE